MAVGGWLYHSYVMQPGIAVSATYESWFDGIFSLLVSLPGASQETGKSNGAAESWWGVVSLGSGMRLVVLVVGHGDTATEVICAENDSEATARSLLSASSSIWFATLPPFVGDVTGAGPHVPGFLPEGALSFRALTALDVGAGEAINKWRRHLHLLVRGSDLVLALAEASHMSPVIDHLLFTGQCLAPLAHTAHAVYPDTHSNSAYAQVAWSQDLGFEVSVSPHVQAYKYDGTRLDAAKTYLGFDTTILSHLIVADPPYPWVAAQVYVSSADIAQDGVIPGNGLKGLVSPEWLRVTVPSIPDKQVTADQNFVHLRGGILVGWDPSNGGIA